MLNGTRTAATPLYTAAFWCRISAVLLATPFFLMATCLFVMISLLYGLVVVLTVAHSWCLTTTARVIRSNISGIGTKIIQEKTGRP